MDASGISSLMVNRSNDSGTAAVAMARAALGTQKMSDEQAGKAAKDFEAMFISQMLEPMFGDSVGDDMFGDSETKDIYKGLMMEQYGKQIVAAGGIGIADYVKKELLKLQEAGGQHVTGGSL